MAKLIYSAITSLDGYIEDAHGKFEWAAPDEEVHRFVNETERQVGTLLLGRRMYETLVYWETAHIDPGLSPVARDFADIWQAADKVVYSRTLESPSSARTRVERSFDPDAVMEMKDSADRNLAIGGAELAASAIQAGLVDELHLYLNPIIVGGGKRSLPDGAGVQLELLDEHRFTGGVVHLRYRAMR